MTGDSQQPQIEKMGIKPGSRMALLRAPAGYREALPQLPERVELVTRLAGWFDVIHYFATSREQLGAVIENLKLHLNPNGVLWISWAKQASPLHTGLTEGIVRELGLRVGLVDVKVAAITPDWSGLKFVYRVADR